jgi:hypothetical protein
VGGSRLIWPVNELAIGGRNGAVNFPRALAQGARGGARAVRCPSEVKEVPPGFEPGMEVLQTSALPLGYGTNKAGNRARTGDLNLGKVALYQLSYARDQRWLRRPSPSDDPLSDALRTFFVRSPDQHRCESARPPAAREA